ncbi:MAG: acyltransferase family protein, partial [Phycisphaerales bacterium]
PRPLFRRPTHTLGHRTVVIDIFHPHSFASPATPQKMGFMKRLRTCIAKLGMNQTESRLPFAFIQLTITNRFGEYFLYLLGSAMSLEQRDQSLDAIKGILIVFVVYGHIAHAGHAANILQLGTNFAYTFHMSAFLLISGFFTHANRGWRQQVIRLVRRLCIPYVVFGLLFIFSRWYAGRHGLQMSGGEASIAPFDLLTGLALGNAVGPIWYIYVLLVFQLCYITVAHLWPKDRTMRFCVLTTAIVLVSMADTPMTLNRGFYLLLGLFIYEMGWPLFSGWAYALLVAVMLCFPLFSHADDPMVRLPWVIGLFGLAHQILVKMPADAFIRIWAFLGRNTLIILFMHPAAINAGKLLRSRFLQFDPSGSSYSLLITLAGVLLPLVFTWISDRISLSPILFGTPAAYSPFRLVSSQPQTAA